MWKLVEGRERGLQEIFPPSHSPDGPTGYFQISVMPDWALNGFRVSHRVSFQVIRNQHSTRSGRPNGNEECGCSTPEPAVVAESD